MGDVKQKKRRFHYRGVLVVAFVFMVMAAVLLVELSGIRAKYASARLAYLPEEDVVTKAEAVSTLPKNTLVLWNSTEQDSQIAFAQFSVMWDDMKVGRQTVDLGSESLVLPTHHTVVVLLMADLSPLGDGLVSLCDWVHSGGRLWLPLTLEANAYASALDSRLGIAETAEEMTVVDSIYLYDGFMLGGGRKYVVSDGYESARTVRLVKGKSTVYAALGDADGIPLVWKTPYGDGAFVVDNFGVYDKVFRGFYAASYSLLEDVCVYPVINGSVFYLDDFPSQIPDGNSEYIDRDYNTTIRDFYVNIWWQDMMQLAEDYGIRYTGLAIESYDNHVDGTADAEPDTTTFLSFGNMLLRMGGEIGYHGYNHQPLCLDNCRYNGVYDYKTWDSFDAMKLAFDDLIKLCDELFPSVNMTVYVPPSNLLSKEGEAFLAREYPHIKTISGIYFDSLEVDFTCTQEFEIAESGIVRQPRIVSGAMVMDDPFMSLAVVSELNLHFANSHFTHPDDALDPERGAELGWAKLFERFDAYADFVYDSAPGIRNLTGSEMSAAVQRFVAVAPTVTTNDREMTVKLDNFYDEAQLMVRLNTEEPNLVSGGELTHLTGDLYLLKATADTVTITFK